MRRFLYDYVNTWWYLCTCNDGEELWIMWINLVIRWWCKYLMYLGIIVWKLICLFTWEYCLMYWIVEYMIFVALQLFLCLWFHSLSIFHPFAGFRLCPCGIVMQVEDAWPAWVPGDSLMLPRFYACFW